MPIKVTCPGCMKRFQVSDQFAGQKGPCPKCKAVIEIPTATEKVVIHGPDNFGPKDSKGRAVLKPIFRQETRLTMAQIVMIAVSVIGSLLVAVALRLQFGSIDPADFPQFQQFIGALILAVPTVLGAYAVLRDQETEAFAGKELWIRIAICAALYVLTWLAFPAAHYAFREYSMISVLIAVVSMAVLGGVIALATFDFEYLMGIIHFGFYLIATILFSWIASGVAIPFGS